MDQNKLETLLCKSGEIVNSHLQNRREKGEDFNLFSILGMETSETKTHSAMLVALLDPKGNHYYNEQFLSLFLKAIGYNDFIDEDLKLVKVKAEYHLGKISEEYDSGGFIDILITFPTGKAIAIENKIDAKDQRNQLYRYSLYKGDDCRLYYLNKTGNPPSKESLHTLTENDYEIITYNNQILKWLEQCLAITKNGSIVENAIKQYMILIKNLTNTMDNHLEEKLNELIVDNLEEAEYIYSHYSKTVDGIREKLRTAVIKEMNLMPLEVIATPGRPVYSNHSKIWLTSESLKVRKVKFGVESFSGKGHNSGRIFIGIFDQKNTYDALRDGDYRLSNYWPMVCDIKTPNNNPLNLSSIKTLQELSRSNEYFEKMVNEIIDQTRKFIETYNSSFF